MMKGFVKMVRDFPLASKLTGLISLLIVVVVLALTIPATHLEQVRFRQELESQSDLLLETLSLTMRDNLYRLELDELVDIATVVSANDNVTLLKIYDTNGALLVDASQPEPIFSQRVDDLGETLIEAGASHLYLDWQEEQLVAGRAIALGNQQIGAVAIGLSTAPLNEKIRALTLRSIGIALVTLALGFGFAFLFARQITTPLGELADIAAQMTAGNLITRAKPKSSDEVGQLGNAFNQMADAIQQREVELKELAAGLERTVAARTAELREQNKMLVETNGELAIARTRAEEATRVKSQFLATISHELRTPLNSVIGYADLMIQTERKNLSDKHIDYLHRILSNGENLLALINDVLDLSKIESGKIVINYQPFSPAELLHSIENRMFSLATSKNIELHSQLDPDLPDPLIGDQPRLNQILTNLVGNAIKFTDEGRVDIRFDKAGDSHWQIVIRDTGIGIPAQAQAYIFDEFRQVDGTPMRKHGGTGLGLSIVRRLVLLMEGSIAVESEVGEGSTFTVQLPLREK